MHASVTVGDLVLALAVPGATTGAQVTMDALRDSPAPVRAKALLIDARAGAHRGSASSLLGALGFESVPGELGCPCVGCTMRGSSATPARDGSAGSRADRPPHPTTTLPEAVASPGGVHRGGTGGATTSVHAR